MQEKLQQEKYERIELKITEFDAEDVITTSAPEMKRDLYEYKLFG